MNLYLRKHAPLFSCLSVQLLLEYGADPSILNAEGVSARNLCIACSHNSMFLSINGIFLYFVRHHLAMHWPDITLY